MDRLSPRQLTTIDLKCRRGMTHAGVGYEMGVAMQTIKNNCTEILRRLGVESMHEACFLYGRDVGRANPAAMRARDV